MSTYVADLDAQLDCLANEIETQRQHLGLPKPKVLWATPPSRLPVGPNSTWGSIGTCPNYYCEAVQRAGGIILNNDSEVRALAPMWPNPGPNSSTLFATVAGEADVILVPGPLWSSGSYLSAAACDTVYSSSAIMPPTVPAVALNRVWDTGRLRDPLGGLDWFVSRVATPDVLVESIAQILYPQINIRSAEVGNAWWQNVYTEAACAAEDAIPTALDMVMQCTNVSAPTVPDRGFVCPGMTTAVPTSTAPGSSGSGAASGGDGDLSTVVIALIVVCSVVSVTAVVLAVQYSQKRRQIAELQDDKVKVMNAVYEGGQ